MGVDPPALVHSRRVRLPSSLCRALAVCLAFGAGSVDAQPLDGEGGAPAVDGDAGEARALGAPVIPLVDDEAPADEARGPDAPPPFRLLPGAEPVAVARRAPGVDGLTGLDRLRTADPGPLGTVRLRLGVTWFEAPDFPIDDTNNVYAGTHLALAFTPLGPLEVALATRATSNANDGNVPRVLQAVGDITLAAKVGGFVTDTLALAAIGQVELVGVVGGGGFSGGGTSYALRAVVTGDFLRGFGWPVRATFAFGYDFENREALVDDRPGEAGVIEEWGLGIARYDRAMVGLGLELPIVEYVSPFVEYHIGTPLQVELTRRGPGSNDFTFETVPHWITPGLRAFPVPSLAVDFGLRYGLSDDVYTGVPATPPWMLTVGVAYTLDPRPQVVERAVEAAAAPPPAPARIGGQVTDAATGQPIAGARVAWPGRDRADQLSGPDGRFWGYAFEPGPVRIEASAEGYRPASTDVELPVGGALDIAFTLDAEPKPAPASIEVTVVDAAGAPTAAIVLLGGEASGRGGEATPTRPFRVELPPGRYPVTVRAEGHAPISRTADVAGPTPLRIALPGEAPEAKKKVAAPRRAPTSGAAPAGPRYAGPRVTVTPRRIRLKRAIGFAPGSDALDADARATLDDLAVGLEQIAIERIRIAAHTDNQGDAAALDRLSNERARAIRAHLMRRGVKAGRLQARGYGGSKPIAPNLTARGRAQNNRVEFIVLR